MRNSSPRVNGTYVLSLSDNANDTEDAATAPSISAQVLSSVST